MSEPVIIEALLVVAALSLVVSRIILDQLRELEQLAANPSGEPSSEVPRPFPTERGSAEIRRHADLIHHRFMLDLGYDWPALDGLLLRFAREPNPHRRPLRDQVQFEAYLVVLA